MDVSHRVLDKQSYTFTEDQLEFEFNLLLNKAMCHKGRIQNPNSNSIAKFVTEYINRK